MFFLVSVGVAQGIPDQLDRSLEDGGDIGERHLVYMMNGSRVVRSVYCMFEVHARLLAHGLFANMGFVQPHQLFIFISSFTFEMISGEKHLFSVRYLLKKIWCGWRKFDSSTCLLNFEANAIVDAFVEGLLW